MAPEQQRQIREWLRQGPSLLYRQHLLDLASVAAAEAANLMISGEPNDIEDATEKFSIAKRALACVTIMEENSNDHYTFQTADLKPETATKTEPAYGTNKPLTFPGSGQTPDPRAID